MIHMYIYIYNVYNYASDLLQCVLLQVWFWMGGQNQDDWQIVSVSLYFFTNLTTALLLTVNPSSLNSLRIEVDLYPNPEKKKQDSLLLVTTVNHLASCQINYDVIRAWAHEVCNFNNNYYFTTLLSVLRSCYSVTTPPLRCVVRWVVSLHYVAFILPYAVHVYTNYTFTYIYTCII